MILTTVEQPLRVCYFGTYRSEYSRNKIMIEGLRRNQVEVIECHAKLWHSIDDRVQALSGGWLRPKFWWRVFFTYARLIQQYRRLDDFDILVVGYPGQFDVILARVLSWLRGKPLVWDVFMSIYLIALERGLDQRSPITVNLISKVEKIALNLPDLLIQDTNEYIRWFEENYNIPRNKFRLIPTGADGSIFHPMAIHTRANGKIRVIYYGTFIPNHGTEFIIEAAKIINSEKEIIFELVGDGPEKSNVVALANSYNLKNVIFYEWLHQSELVQQVARASICLGAFGTTPQSIMTVQNKIYEGLAMGKAVITGDSQAVRGIFEDKENIYLCERADAGSLANAILALRDDNDLREKIAQNGYDLFSQKYDIDHIGQSYKAHLIELISHNELDMHGDI